MLANSDINIITCFIFSSNSLIYDYILKTWAVSALSAIIDYSKCLSAFSENLYVKCSALKNWPKFSATSSNWVNLLSKESLIVSLIIYLILLLYWSI